MNEIELIMRRLDKISEMILTSKAVLSLDEAAAFTSLSKSYLYKLTSTGGIPCYKPHGKHIYFQKSELESWLLQNRKYTYEELQNRTVDL